MSDIVERLRTRDAYLSLDEAADALEALSARLAEAEQRRMLVYAWLGLWRDKLPPDAVANLQNILGPLVATDSASLNMEPCPDGSRVLCVADQPKDAVK